MVLIRLQEEALGAIKAGQFINVFPISDPLLAFFILEEPITLSLAIGGYRSFPGYI